MTDAAAALEIMPATRADIPMLLNLLEFYVYDFTEFWAGEARGEIGADGRFGFYPLEPFFEREHWSAHILKVGPHIAGFALLNDEAHSGRPIDRSMAEFFVLRKHRGAGLALEAATRLIRARPGSWEIAIARKNLPAQRFWPKVVAACAEAGSVEALDLTGPGWNGPIYRFRVA